MKSGTPPLQSVRLLDQVRERIRYMHYSLSSEKVYLYWVRFFIRWHDRNGTMKHPRDMGAPQVEAFLTMLATERKMPSSTHNQALSALLFLYRVWWSSYIGHINRLLSCRFTLESVG